MVKKLPRQFRIQMLAAGGDGIFVKIGNKYYLWSADPAHDHQADTSMKTVVEEFFNSRAALGATLKTGSGLFTQDGQIDIPNTADDLSWLLRGNGVELTKFTSDGGLTNDFFLSCAKSAWGTPQERTYVGTDGISFIPYGDEDGIISAPYCLPKIGDISIIGDVEDSTQNRHLYYGGSGGPNAPSRIRNYHSKQVGLTSDYGEMYMWLDNLMINKFSISRHGSLVEGLFRFAGEYFHIDQGTFYISPGCTITSLIYAAGARVSADKLTVNDGSATVDIFRCLTDGFIECGVLFMPASMGLYYDATSEYLTRINALYHWVPGPTQTWESRLPKSIMLVNSNTSSISHPSPGTGPTLSEWTSNQRLEIDLTRYKWITMTTRINDPSASGFGKVSVYNVSNSRILCEQELALGMNYVDIDPVDISDETGVKIIGLYDYSGDGTALGYYNFSYHLWP